MTKKLSSNEVKDIATDKKTPADQDRETRNNRMKRLEDLPGLGPKTAEKLRELGYSFVGLATARADAVSAEMGQSVSYVKATAWIKAAQTAILSVMKPKTGKEIARERRLKRVFYKTGSADFNKLLGGGFASLRTTGLSGRFSSGKTQAEFDTIVDCLSRDKYHYCPMCDFLHDKLVNTCSSCGKEMFRQAAYIETETDTYSDQRLEQIAKIQGKEIDLDNLWVLEAKNIPTAKAQYLQYKIIQKLIQQKQENIGLVCIDSFTAKFRPGYSRSEMLPVRTREFAEHFLLMDYLIAKYNMAWVLSCQVIGGVRKEHDMVSQMKTGGKFYPVGGELFLHSVTTWVGMQQVKTQTWKAILFDSSYLPRDTCEFMLTKKGLADGVK